MADIKFEWVESKSLINKKKRGVSFEEEKSVFFDERGLLISDTDHSDEEDRFILFGMPSNLKVLVVCHCYRGDDDVVRIISARCAGSFESNSYSKR